MYAFGIEVKPDAERRQAPGVADVFVGDEFPSHSFGIWNCREDVIGFAGKVLAGWGFADLLVFGSERP